MVQAAAGDPVGRGTNTMTELYQIIGAFAGGVAGGLVGGRKAFKALQHEVRDLRETLENVCDYLTDRFGMPQVAKPKNGKTADLGLVESLSEKQARRESKERN
jgi:hypothetical protein